jgi:hypothetical protein
LPQKHTDKNRPLPAGLTDLPLRLSAKEKYLLGGNTVAQLLVAFFHISTVGLTVYQKTLTMLRFEIMIH